MADSFSAATKHTSGSKQHNTQLVVLSHMISSICTYCETVIFFTRNVHSKQFAGLHFYCLFLKAKLMLCVMNFTLLSIKFICSCKICGSLVCYTFYIVIDRHTVFV